MNATPKETPEQAAHRLAAAAVRGSFTTEALHCYRDVDGEPIYWRWRARKSDGQKTIRPMRYDGSAFVAGEPAAPATGKVLYRLPELVAADRGAVVLVVEGEWCADHLAERGLIVTTSGGSSSTDSADWSPLAGCHVVLWPDNDPPGRKYADAVTRKLLTLGCTVERIDIASLGLPDKGDTVDWLKAHPDSTAADVLALGRITGDLGDSGLAIGDAPRVQLLCAADVAMEPIRWLWPDWLAQGKFHILAGAPGTGKTTAALSWAASVSAGTPFPNGWTPSAGHVLIWTGEDDPADTLVPRLAYAGADLRKVHFVQGIRDVDGVRSFDPATDVGVLEAQARSMGNVALLIVDPIVSAVRGDSHKNADVRRDLQPLVDLGQRLDCAVLGITHLSKGTSGREPWERITGSLAFAALARVVYLAARQKSEDGEAAPSLLVRAKSNIGPTDGGFAYTLEQGEARPGIEASRTRWGGPIEGSARELLADAEAADDARQEAHDIESWLRDQLGDGRMPMRELERTAREEGFSTDQLKRAKRRIGAETEREGFGKSSVCYWRLPHSEPIGSIGGGKQSPHAMRSMGENAPYGWAQSNDMWSVDFEALTASGDTVAPWALHAVLGVDGANVGA